MIKKRVHKKEEKNVTDFRQLRTSSYILGALLDKYCPKGHRAVAVKLVFMDEEGNTKEVVLKVPGVNIQEQSSMNNGSYSDIQGFSDMSYSECPYCPMDYVGE